MADRDPEYTVAVVVWNAGRFLADCVAALEAQSFRRFEVLLVDNASTDGAIESLGRLPANTRVVRAGRNLGFAAANNLAAREARGRWLVALNPDAFPEPDWLAEIDRGVRRHPGAAMFGSTQLRADAPGRLDGAGDHYHPLGLAWRGGEGDPAETADRDAEVFGPCAAAAAYRMDAFARAGGFEESFFCYYEDVDLAFRLRLAGERCVQLARARVRHVGSGVAGDGSAFMRRHVARNRVWTFLRCMPGPLLALLSPGLAASLLAWLLVGVARGDGADRARALADALRGLPGALAARRRIQAGRRVGAGAVARAMTWSVGKMLLRARDARPLAEDAAEAPGGPARGGRLDAAR